jgi:hypothetical protein
MCLAGAQAEGWKPASLRDGLSLEDRLLTGVARAGYSKIRNMP